jgi:septal ring factor EnvC (AmiA/AmiB activator)
LLSSVAYADEDTAPASSDPIADGDRADDVDPRTALGAQLTDQAAVIDRTLALVTEKLTAAQTVRAKRLRAAYRVLRASPHRDATADDRMAIARRRAAARLLVDRDAAERGLLAEEATRLEAAARRTTADTQKLATITLPQDLGRPAKGTIARKFGVLEHERSKAMLSRRGIDIEVEGKAVVSAPADGTVRYAGPIRGLDDGLVIDHGDYFTVIAKLGELAVPVGAPVHRGDRLGRAARHRVYLEVRVRIGPGGIPIDPEPLLEKSHHDPG